MYRRVVALLTVVAAAASMLISTASASAFFASSFTEGTIFATAGAVPLLRTSLKRRCTVPVRVGGTPRVSSAMRLVQCASAVDAAAPPDFDDYNATGDCSWVMGGAGDVRCEDAIARMAAVALRSETRLHQELECRRRGEMAWEREGGKSKAGNAGDAERGTGAARVRRGCSLAVSRRCTPRWMPAALVGLGSIRIPLAQECARFRSLSNRSLGHGDDDAVASPVREYASLPWTNSRARRLHGALDLLCDADSPARRLPPSPGTPHNLCSCALALPHHLRIFRAPPISYTFTTPRGRASVVISGSSRRRALSPLWRMSGEHVGRKGSVAQQGQWGWGTLMPSTKDGGGGGGRDTGREERKFSRTVHYPCRYASYPRRRTRYFSLSLAMDIAFPSNPGFSHLRKDIDALSISHRPPLLSTFSLKVFNPREISSNSPHTLTVKYLDNMPSMWSQLLVFGNPECYPQNPMFRIQTPELSPCRSVSLSNRTFSSTPKAHHEGRNSGVEQRSAGRDPSCSASVRRGCRECPEGRELKGKPEFVSTCFADRHTLQSADLVAKVERLEGLIEEQQRNEVKAAPDSKASSHITDADVDHRTDLAAREAALKKGEEKLRTEKALLAHEKEKFERSQRGASKRAPEFLDDLDLDSERYLVGPSRKRLRTDATAQADKINQLFGRTLSFPDRNIGEARRIPFSFKERAASPAFRPRTPPNGGDEQALFGSRTRIDRSDLVSFHVPFANDHPTSTSEDFGIEH
ncbi:hypothetical protein C8R45DRAFT_941937 [Mycena sanguinolenta]|nr:hypothetical protein C8R45DRAFT_941937 [Mycena sanguinolenta]